MTHGYDVIAIDAGMAGVAAANSALQRAGRSRSSTRCLTGAGARCAGATRRRSCAVGAEIVDSARMMRGKGIVDEGLSVNWSDLMKHKDAFTDPVPQKMEKGLTCSGVETLHGVARFADKNSIVINGTRYEATHILIQIRRLPGAGSGPHCRTGDRYRRLARAYAGELVARSTTTCVTNTRSRWTILGGHPGSAVRRTAQAAARAGTLRCAVARAACHSGTWRSVGRVLVVHCVGCAGANRRLARSSVRVEPDR